MRFKESLFVAIATFAFFTAGEISTAQLAERGSTRPTPNLRFRRIADIDADGTDEWGLIGSTAVQAAAGAFIPTDDQDNAADVQVSFLSLPGLEADIAAVGSHATGFVGPMTGRITAVPNQFTFIPEHEWATGHEGLSEVTLEGSLAVATVETEGYLRAWYQIRPPRRPIPGPNNNWGTVRAYLYFLASGSNLEVLGRSDNAPDCWSPNNQYFASEGFRHRIIIGESDIQVHHAGDGVFIMYGCLANSDELDASQSSEPYYTVLFGGVNHLLHGTQKVPLHSGSNIAITTEVLQHSVTGWSRGPVGIDGDIDFQLGRTDWIWAFTTKGWFDGKDLSASDAPPGGSAPAACTCLGS